jgi:hypothetical protein
MSENHSTRYLASLVCASLDDLGVCFPGLPPVWGLDVVWLGACVELLPGAPGGPFPSELVT